jgi:hypothetical protein
MLKDNCFSRKRKFCAAFEIKIHISPAEEDSVSAAEI